MGQSKAFMIVRNETSLAFSIRQLAHVIAMPLWITLPIALWINRHHHPLLQFSRSALYTLNHYPAAGYWGSILSVLNHLPTNSDGLIITPVDTPIFSDRLVHLIMSLAHNLRSQPVILVPCSLIDHGHPIYVSRHFFAAMKLFNGDGGLRAFIHTQSRHVHALCWSDRRISCNLNTPHDLARLSV